MTITKAGLKLRIFTSLKVCCVSLVAMFLFAASAFAAPVPAATYLFNDTFNAIETGAPALVPVDPLGLNVFEDASVFGVTRRVYRFDGNRFPVEEQAGLSLATDGLIPYNNYSAELVFEFTETNGVWRRIIDVNNRMSDNGFYVEPSNFLQVWENGELATGTTFFTTNEFHHVVLTNDSTGFVKAYLDGVLEFTTPATSAMNINNPESLMNFFLDNIVDGGQGEFADGRIALLRVFDSILSESDVATLARNPFVTIVAIDIKPGSFPNSINLGSMGVVPVAILSTETFDATTVDPSSVTLASAPVQLKGKGSPMASLDDVNGDGLPDLIVQVSTEALQISETDTVAVLEGKTFDGLFIIMGSDSIRIVP